MSRVSIQLRLDDDVLDKITTRAVEKDKSRNAWIEAALIYVLAQTAGVEFTRTERVKV